MDLFLPEFPCWGRGSSSSGELLNQTLFGCHQRAWVMKFFIPGSLLITQSTWETLPAPPKWPPLQHSLPASSLFPWGGCWLWCHSHWSAQPGVTHREETGLKTSGSCCWSCPWCNLCLSQEAEYMNRPGCLQTFGFLH